jgi:uncharacterized protein (TIGR02246 family)
MLKENENSQQLAEKLFNRWNKLLQSKSPSTVAKMYSEKASFLPTLNGELKRGRKGAEEYFEHFLQKNPFGVIKESVAQLIDNNEQTLLFAGLYDFEVDSETGERTTASARFTFIFQKEVANEGDDIKQNDKEGGDTDDLSAWKIIHHHSSLKPE